MKSVDVKQVQTRPSPIFIVGSGRSGTTLLRAMLNAHRDIHISYEAAYYLFNPRLQPGRHSESWLNFYRRFATYRWLNFDDAEVARRIPVDLDKSEFWRMFAALMQMQAERFGKRRYGDKTPGHTSFLKRIFNDFPEARVIHIVRDPRATVRSMAGMPWAFRSFLFNAVYAASQCNAAERYRDRVFEIRLEDLIAEPERHMREILQYLGEAWDPAVLNHARHAPRDDMPPFPWLHGATRPPATGLSGSGASAARSQGLFSPVEMRLIELVNRRTMRRFGYGRDPRAAMDRIACAGRVLRELPVMLGDIGRLLVFLRRCAGGRMRRGEEIVWLNEKAWERYPGFRIQHITEWEDSLCH